LKLLRDLWILEKSGVAFFHREFDKSVSPQMFGAMMSALNMFAEQLADGGLSNFELKNSRFTLIKQSDLLFIATSSNEIRQKKVNKELKKISDRFIILYSEKLKNFKGKIGGFSNFINEIEDSLEEKPNEKD
jgi:hypothetical protein